MRWWWSLIAAVLIAGCRHRQLRAVFVIPRVQCIHAGESRAQQLRLTDATLRVVDPAIVLFSLRHVLIPPEIKVNA